MPRESPHLLGLSIQQPWAELILRGVKTMEIRAVPVAPGKRVYLYAGKKMSSHSCAAEAILAHGLSGLELETGKVLGSVEIAGCRASVPADAPHACVSADLLAGNYSWLLESPRRLAPPVAPLKVPYGMWFYPFRAPIVKQPGGRS